MLKPIYISMCTLVRDREREMITVPLFVFVSAFVVILVGYTSFTRKSYGRKGSKLPPGNMSLPLIGETLSFVKPHLVTDIGEFMDHHISRFGKIFSSNLMGSQKIVSADAELNRFILKNEATMFEPGWPRGIVKLLGESAVILLIGDAHKKVRSMYLNFMSSERLRTVFLQDAEELASLILGSWKGSVISAKDEANKFSFYIMVKELINMGSEEPTVEKLRREYETYAQGLASLPLYLPGTAYWKAFKAKANVVNIFTNIIKERIKEKVDGNAKMEDYDFLSWVMKNTNYSQGQIGDLFLQLLFAGHDTTSRALSLIIYFLEGCPKAIEQLREEHQKIVRLKKQNGEGKLTWDDYKAMNFSNCVINEVLRLGNIATHLHKKTTVDFQFKGYLIPRGCTVISHIAAVHLDPTLFEDPNHFNPWRWLCPSGLQKSNDFMPFGGGTRLCVGQDLARLEMIVFIHHLILKYDWELVEPDQPMCLPLVDFPKGLQIKIRALSTQ